MFHNKIEENFYYLSDDNKFKIRKNKHINLIVNIKDEKKRTEVIKKNIYNKLYIANNFKYLRYKAVNGIYISSYNKTIYPPKIKKNQIIIGSAHNIKEIFEKIRAGCSVVFLSPVYQTTKLTKRNWGIVKFLLIAQLFSIKIYPLGGIEKNRNVRNFGIKGICGIRYFEGLNASFK